MQRRIAFRRLPLGLSLLPCLALTAGMPALAQPLSPAGDAPRTTPRDAEQVLLVIRREPKLPARDVTTLTNLQDETLAMLRGSGRYQVLRYALTNEQIKRLLTDHVISSIDLSEPLQPQGMQHVALALGIRTVLMLTPTIDKEGLKMAVELYQNVGQDIWQLGATGDVNTPIQYGKRRLNTKELVAVAVDGLASRLNLPSHLAADLNIKSLEVALDKTQEAKKPDRTAQAHKDPPTNTAQNANAATKNPGSGTNPDTGAAQNPPTVTQVDPTPPVPPPSAPVKTIKTDKSREVVATKPIKTDKPNKVDKTNKTGRTSEQAIATLNQADVVNSGVFQFEVPVTPTVSHPNYETQSDHFHDNKDLANTITLLRYAINERPRDVALRRKLILAYQERNMAEAALAEINRAMQIAPTEGSLYRSYGETLMTRGDVPGAEKAFRDALRINPDDILARIALGDALMNDNQYADALDAYTSAQKSDPHSPLPHRRLARVLLLRAAADPAQYNASLDEINKGRELTPKNDPISYQQDYSTLMLITESRLRELLEEISANQIAFTQGKQNATDTQRALSDIQLRNDAISNYLDKLPTAVGQDKTQVQYQQATTLVLQSLALFRTYLTKVNDMTLKQQMQDVASEAYQALSAGHQRLGEIRAALLPK